METVQKYADTSSFIIFSIENPDSTFLLLLKTLCFLVIGPASEVGSVTLISLDDRIACAPYRVRSRRPPTTPFS